MGNIYDDPVFFDTYAQMDRSRKGLEGAGEWHQLVRLFPDMEGKNVLDLGCGYGWHSKYAAENGAGAVTLIRSIYSALIFCLCRFSCLLHNMCGLVMCLF